MVTGEDKIVNFITPGAMVLVLRCGQISYIVKIHYFYPLAQIRQTMYIVIKNKEGST